MGLQFILLNDRKKAGTTYYNLGSDTLSTLQTHLEQLMVVIIDEISMIGAQTLYRIHMCLQEIKGLHYSNTRFGNVTIIAVGDLYQLPPLKDKKIYDMPRTGDDPNPVCLHQSLWQENFYFHELKHIVRQKNKQFAQLLNRVREAKITEQDETTLKGRVTTLDHPDHFTDALHVYGTNQQVDQYNATMLQKLDTPKYVIQSSDITRDREMRQVKISLDGKKRTDTGGLPSHLTIAENAYVRLTSNIYVTDGLANGVRGIIQKIVTNEDGAVNTILVKFDNEGIGQKAKASSPTIEHMEMPYQFIDMEYHSSIEILPYFAVNFLSCCHGQVQSILSKDLQLAKLLSTCQRYLLQDKHMWPSAELLHWKDYKSLTTTVLQSKKTRE